MAQPGMTRLVAVTEVDVGCKGRREQVHVTELRLAQNMNGLLIYRGIGSVSHKCGDTRPLTAQVEVRIPAQHAYQDQSGVLHSPAINAQGSCTASTGWLNQAGCRILALQ